MTDAELAEYRQLILADVEAYGWFCVVVLGDDEAGSPPFAYSVGFTETLGCPEFLVFGLPDELMFAMLEGVFLQIEGGRVPEDGARWGGLIEGFECVSRAVDPARLGSGLTDHADWFRRERGGDEPAPVHQLVWPGADDGLFPWDEGCELDVVLLQPPMYAPPETAH